MINRRALLADLQKLLATLEADLLERSESDEVPDVGRTLRADFERAREAERTAQNYEDWRTDYTTQTAAAWVLSCVFVRFLEDNQLIDPPRIAGPGERLARARDELELFIREAKAPNERDYLLAVFDDLAKLPGTADLFGPHNPIRELPTWLSGDGAKELLRFFQRIDPGTGALVHDFTDPKWDTRFLGDLYQDLSEAARKKYALLQTPEFVEEFILERTLEPALEEFGVEAAPILDREGDPRTDAGFRMIDPACGSGHFLLGAFRRILVRWQRQEPGTNVRALVQRALDSVYGVDVNPYAVAIARFRLLLAALAASGVKRLKDAPAFRLNLACGDSLLHGAGEQLSLGWHEVDHAYAAEDLPALQRILRPGTFHAVVANPPYITPKDRALNQAYRDRYSTCHMKYSLAVPFMQRIFDLACPGGSTGQITANSFIKREFGKKLIEEFFPKVDLTHVIDTSGAYIPGHGTPTVILLGRHRKPLANVIRTVLGIRGEPSTPDDPQHGLVWSAILEQVDNAGSQSEFVSVSDSARELLLQHPWSLGGGGAAELKERLEEVGTEVLSSQCESIGFASFTGQDEAFVADRCTLARNAIANDYVKPFVVGDTVRDWMVAESGSAFAPYDVSFEPIDFSNSETWARWLWPVRTAIGAVVSFGGRTRLECGDKWWTWYRWVKEKYRSPLSIVYAEVASHNHFVLDRGKKVFKQTAPVIKLPPDATEDEHHALLGLLNSSTLCFWMVQVSHCKGEGERGLEAEQWFRSYQFNANRLLGAPIFLRAPIQLSRQIDGLGSERVRNSPAHVLAAQHDVSQSVRVLAEHRSQCEDLRRRMIALQEELDWECYRLYGLIDEDLTMRDGPPAIDPGQRAFEIVLARKMAAGEVQTIWFERHGSTPTTEIPDHLPEDYKRLVQRRIDLIESDPNIALIEQPEYKRRWATEPWESQLRRALREWLLERLESYFDFDGRMRAQGGGQKAEVEEPEHQAPIGVGTVISIAKLADIAGADPDFCQVAALYTDDPAFDVPALVIDLVEDESVPLLPILRYKPSGLRKRSEWERTWDLQRREDAGEQVGTIPVPPKYTSADFLKSSYWRLRGKLDVPKERWVSFPHAEAPDGTLVIAWAGYDHLQLARAVSAWYVEIQEHHGGRDDPRLVPLLAGLLELLPWLKQWHNDVDPEFGLPMGDYFEGFIQEEARGLGKTLDEMREWTPPARARGRRTKAQK